MRVGMGLCAAKKNKVDNLQDDLFAFKINYNDADTATDLFNGNISETYWKTSTDNKKRKYDYKYDDLNRLLQADYSKQANTTFNSYLEHLSYDKNGNIKTLKRNGGMDTDGYQFANPIDNLTYLYDTDNKNQLLRVFDATANAQGFKDDTDGSNISIDVAQEPDYKYDANGNMTKDDNKGIKTITYNHLNLPTKITFANQNYITYLYNATGQKVNKVVTENNMITTTEYLNGFQYVNNNLQFFPHAEGYVKVTGTSYDYVYNYTDHLGNIRLSYSKDINTNALKVIEENHYYPFGLKHTGYNSDRFVFVPIAVTTGGKFNTIIRPYRPDTVVLDYNSLSFNYDYLYNGKEYQDELGLNMYDYGARNYDAALGRWMNVDPLAEKYYDNSSYTYAINNPVFFIDPNGKEVDVSALADSKKKDDQWLLVQMTISLADISGMTISKSTDKNGKTTLKGKENKDATGESSTASKYISHLLTMSETITVGSSKEGTGSWPNGEVVLDAAQINGIQKGLEKKGIDKDVMSVGMAFLHETIHTVGGANWWKKQKSEEEKDNLHRYTDFGIAPGFVERRLNVFREEMGLSTLYRYTQPSTMYVLVKGKKVEVPISNVEVK